VDGVDYDRPVETDLPWPWPAQAEAQAGRAAEPAGVPVAIR
jgi:hypothetical protein